jgi:hypothetical protein
MGRGRTRITHGERQVEFKSEDLEGRKDWGERDKPKDKVNMEFGKAGGESVRLQLSQHKAFVETTMNLELRNSRTFLNQPSYYTLYEKDPGLTQGLLK